MPNGTDPGIDELIAEKRTEKVRKLVALITANAVRQGLHPQRDAARMAKAARSWAPVIWRKLGKATGNSAGKVPSEEVRERVIAALEAKQIPVCDMGHDGCTDPYCSELAGAQAEYAARAEDDLSNRSCIKCFGWSAGDECVFCGFPNWPEQGVCPTPEQRAQALTEYRERLAREMNADFDAMTGAA